MRGGATFHLGATTWGYARAQPVHSRSQPALKSASALSMSFANVLEATPAAEPPPAWATAVAIALLVLVVALPLFALRRVGDRRAGRILDAWARENGFVLDAKELIVVRWRRAGPFAQRPRWTSVFRIRARTATGEARTGWVCMNNVFVWGSAPDVRWDGTG